MPHTFEIRFPDEPHIDHVIVAVAPIDAFTGRIITTGISASLKGLPNRPVRNRSGMLVFVRKNGIPEQARYEIEVNAEKAGYFNPDTPILYSPPATDNSNRANKPQIDVPLMRRPTSAIDTDATTVAGVVVRAAQPVAGATVFAELPTSMLPPGGATLAPFETRSDERGAFALMLRLPAGSVTAAVTVKFKFSEGTDVREIVRLVAEGKFYSFEEPIEMNIDNEPQLIPFGG